jgi:phosphate/sulfate permease
MELHNILLIIALVFGFYAAWNIGANDVANAMGTSVGSGALTLRRAVILAAIFEFLGAVLFGSNVSETLQKGIVNPDFFSDRPYELVNGMLASLLATGLWLQLASYFGWPVSTTHTIVGAILGFGVIVEIQSVEWNSVLSIACSWIVSPLLGGAAAYLIFSLLRFHIFYSRSPLEATKKFMPWIASTVVVVLSLFLLYRVQIGDIPSSVKIAVAALLGCATFFLCSSLLKRLLMPQLATEGADPHLLIEVDKAKKHLLRIQSAMKGELGFHLSDILEDIDGFSYALQKSNVKHTESKEFQTVEKIFGFLQISSACLMAFAHGSNDVSNAIGPMAAIFSVLTAQGTTVFPQWALILGGLGIVIGLATWGWRVIETIGKRITELTPSRGFSAEFGASLTILLASRLAFPVSTTHTLVGAVFGVGLAGGLGALNLRTLRDILLSWIVTIPAGAALSVLCYYILKAFLG